MKKRYYELTAAKIVAAIVAFLTFSTVLMLLTIEFFTMILMKVIVVIGCHVVAVILTFVFIRILERVFKW